MTSKQRNGESANLGPDGGEDGATLSLPAETVEALASAFSVSQRQSPICVHTIGGAVKRRVVPTSPRVPASGVNCASPSQLN